MEHFSVIQTLCRIGLEGTDPRFRKQVERLRDRLRTGGDEKAATAVERLLAGVSSEHGLTPIRRFGITFVPLSRRPGGVQAFKMIIPASPEPLEPTPQTHDGFEWLYVLNGHLRLGLGERDLTLPPGEAA